MARARAVARVAWHAHFAVTGLGGAGGVPMLLGFKSVQDSTTFKRVGVAIVQGARKLLGHSACVPAATLDLRTARPERDRVGRLRQLVGEDEGQLLQHKKGNPS